MKLAKVAKIAVALMSIGSIFLLAACGNGMGGVAQSTGPTIIVFDWEQGIALHAVQGYRASSFSEREV